MIENKYIELINKDIDKVISPSEKAILLEYLSANAEAKKYYDEMVIMAEYLNTMKETEPDPGLEQRIINSIDFSRYSSDRKQHRRILSTFTGSAGWLKFAFVFIGIFALALIYALLIQQNNIDDKNTRGTMGIESKRVYTMDEIEIKKNGVYGSVRVLGSGDSFWLDVDLKASKPFDLIIDFPDGVDYIDSSPNTMKIVESQNGVQLPGIATSEQLNIYFSKNINTAQLTLKIIRAENTLFEKKLSIENN